MLRDMCVLLFSLDSNIYTKNEHIAVSFRYNNMIFGCQIRVKQDVTKSHIMALCKDLALHFGPGHEFSPLSRCEGGISWNMWPGKRDQQYKSVRLCVNGKNRLQWPQVVDDKWQNNHEDVAIQCDTDVTIHHIRFRARYVHIRSYDLNASWTRKEWNTFRCCLRKYV